MTLKKQKNMDMLCLNELVARLKELSKFQSVNQQVLDLRVKLVKKCLTFESKWADHLAVCKRYLIKGKENPGEMEARKAHITAWLTDEDRCTQIHKELRELFQTILDISFATQNIQTSVQYKNWWLNAAFGYTPKNPHHEKLQQILASYLQILESRQPDIFTEAFDLDKVTFACEWLKNLRICADRAVFHF